MNKRLGKISNFVAVAAMMISLTGCSDDNTYSISEATVDLDRTEVGQLSAHSSVIPFNIVTDKDAEWEATVEWDEDANDQPAYVYPKKGVGPQTLKIATLDNVTQQIRKAQLVIRFPKDESKNITVDLTQQRPEVVNGEELRSGNIACGVGYGYNAFAGYAEDACVKAPILRVDEMRDNDVLVYNFSSLRIERREESGASVEELARKLNTTAHASTEFGGFKGSVDAAFNIGQKSTSSNEFAWMDLNVRSGRVQLHGAQDDVILEYMTDEAYANINGMPKVVRGKERITYPSTEEGFRKLVLAYGTHLCVAAVLGGQMRTSVVANTSKINTAYNASVALEAAYNSDWGNIDLNATAKAQQASAVSSNHSGFYFQASVRGGNRDDGSLSALSSVLNKMSKARQGTGTQDDLTDDSDTKVTISDDSEEFEMAGQEWMNSLTTANGLTVEEVLRNLVFIDFDGDGDLVPLYELIDRDLTLEEDGVDGEARYQAFKQWYGSKLMNDPEILKQRPNLSSYITIPPTKVDPMPDMTNSSYKESLVQDIYLTNGQHVARICSEFIPVINPSKRVNVIYPIVNGKPRYNLGIFCGDEASYPAQVSWGWEDSPNVPVVTTIKGSTMGQHRVAYLRGNHLTLEADTSFQDNQYLTTIAKPFYLVSGSSQYPIVKINDYLYTRKYYTGTSFQDGTNYENDSATLGLYEGKGGTKFYGVRHYTTNQKYHGGFAPTGWDVPYLSQYEKMLEDLNAIPGSKPDGSIGKSFMESGVLGLNLNTGGFIYDGRTDYNARTDYTYVINESVLYLGGLSSEDKGFWDGVTNFKEGSKSVYRCEALSVDANSGNVTFVSYPDKAPQIISAELLQKKVPHGYDEIRNWLINDSNNDSGNSRGNKILYPLIICQQAVK